MPSNLPETTRGKLYLNAFWRRRWLMIGCVGATLLLGGAYVRLVEPVYEAQVRVVIQDRGLALDGQSSKTYDKEFLSTQAEIIRSPLIIELALRDTPPPETTEPDDDPVGTVHECLRVSPLAGTDIVMVSFQHADPNHATDRIRSILQSYQQHLNETEQVAAGETMELLARREKELRGELELLQQQYMRLRAESPLLGDARDAISVETTTLKDLSDRLADVRARRTLLAASLGSVSDADVSLDWVLTQPLGNTLSHNIRALYQQLVEARANARELQKVYGPLHPEFQLTTHRVALLEEELRQQQAAAIAGLRQQLDVLIAEEQALEGQDTFERSRLKQVDRFLLEEQRLQANLLRVERLYTTALAALEGVQLADQALADGRASILVQILDDFVAPVDPIWPQPIPFMALSGLLGLFLSTVAILFIERLPLPGVLQATNHRDQTAGTDEGPVTQPSLASDESLQDSFTGQIWELQEMIRQARRKEAVDSSAKAPANSST
jgi:uncharacterized protein involved in exopolysaccharide biosynthesis